MESKIVRNKKDYVQTASGNIVCRRTILCGSQNIHLLGTCIIDSGVILRGDLVMIRIGQYVILEPDCVIRPCFKKIKGKYGSVPISIGDCVQIGEKTVVMASSIGSNVFIGKNSIIGPGSVIKDNCTILPDTVIPPNTLVPPFTEWGGVPGTMLRRLPESQGIVLQQSAIEYYNNFQLVSGKTSAEPEKIEHSNTIIINSMKTGISRVPQPESSEVEKDREDDSQMKNNPGGKPKSEQKSLFNETVREIRKLVYPHLDKFQRQQYDNARAKVLGIKQKKSQKMPLPELLSRQKATKRHIERRKLLEDELDVKLYVGDKANRFEAEKDAKKRRRNRVERRRMATNLSSKGFSEKSGVVYVGKNILKKK
ncbi:Dynactin subunit 5 [Cryptosporidium felis]|nr:Dynactin subunit 5 [Cryptosporidium felis]